MDICKTTAGDVQRKTGVEPRVAKQDRGLCFALSTHTAVQCSADATDPCQHARFSLRASDSTENGKNMERRTSVTAVPSLPHPALFLFCASHAAGYAGSLGRPIEKEGQENKKKQRKS
jgi:hypothetical protein